MPDDFVPWLDTLPNQQRRLWEELAADLPLHHRDLFARSLVAQAIAAPAQFYAADAMPAAYSELETLVL